MKFKHVYALMATLLVVGLLVPVVGCAAEAPAPAPTMELRFSSPLPEVSIVCKFQSFFLDEVTARTNGRITFERFWGGTLVGPAEVLDAPGAGVVDISMGLWIYAPGKVPLGNFEYNFPFNDPDMRTQVKIKREMFEEIPALNEELAQFNIAPIFTLEALPPYNLLSLEPIRTLDDLKGKKVGHTPVEYTPIFEAAGAVSVISPATEFYARLERGVVDAICLPMVIQEIFKPREVAKHYTTIDIGSPVAYTLWMNLDVWNSLTSADKKLFQEVGNEAQEVHIAALEAAEATVRATYEEDGVTFYTMPAADIGKWMNAMPDVVADWAEDMEANGLPGWEVAEMYLELSAREGWKYPRQWGIR